MPGSRFSVPGSAWLDLDPTNDQLVNGNHVTLAWGRDYSDVSPVKGALGGEQVIRVAAKVGALEG
jgi:transglutaminase-like putative cysteine protease